MKAMNIDKIRQRAAEVVVEKHGQLGHQAIRALAANAGIHETVLGRILLPDQYKNPTRKPRKSTLAALAAALGVSANWLVHGVGSRQIDVWPSLVRMEADSPEPLGSARDELMAAVDAMVDLPERLQRRAYRAAVGGAIDAVSAQGVTVPVRAYRALVRLDELQITRSGDAA